MKTGFDQTPLHKLETLSKMYDVNIYIKRDDMTGLGMGGNKLRKLDYFVKDALDKGATTLLTYGGVQTNHGRLTAAAAAKFGLKCILILFGPAPATMSGNLILDKLMGADIYFANNAPFKDLPKEEAAKKQKELLEKVTQQAIADYEEKGEKVYSIPVGGSNLLGILGYLECAKEIKEQCERQKISPKYLYCGYGSAGTFGGLTLGSKLYNCPFEVHGVAVSEKNTSDLQGTVDYINQACQEYELDFTFTLEDIYPETEYFGLGYNIPDPKTREAVYLLAQTEGILTDMCYTGKAFLGMIENIKKGKIKKGETVIFLHTGGTPGLFTTEHQAAMEQELWKNGYKEISL